MEAVAIAALAAIVDHDHARVLDQLLHENVALRQQLQELQQQRLKVRKQALDIFQLRNTVVEQSLHIARLRSTIEWARHDVRIDEIKTAEQRLTGCFDDENVNAEQ